MKILPLLDLLTENSEYKNHGCSGLESSTIDLPTSVKEKYFLYVMWITEFSNRKTFT